MWSPETPNTSVSTLPIFTLTCSSSFCTRFRSRVASWVSCTRRRVKLSQFTDRFGRNITGPDVIVT